MCMLCVYLFPPAPIMMEVKENKNIYTRHGVKLQYCPAESHSSLRLYPAATPHGAQSYTSTTHANEHTGWATNTHLHWLRSTVGGKWPPLKL